MKNETRSPCIGICVLDPEMGSFCIGCFRMKVEITDWMYYTDAEKAQINQRITELRAEDPADYPDYR